MLRPMLRHFMLGAALALCVLPAAAAVSRYSDLYGHGCKVIERDRASGATTRRCPGVAGYSLLVHEASGQTSVDILTPQRRLYPLEYWEVVTPGYARVGRKAEWRLETRRGKLVPVALLVRLNTISPRTEGPRIAAGGMITAARIAGDGACVVYQGNGALPAADATARAAAADPRRKCLGVFNAAGARAPL